MQPVADNIHAEGCTINESYQLEVFFMYQRTVYGRTAGARTK